MRKEKRLLYYHSFLKDVKNHLFQYERKIGRTRNIVTIV